MLWWQTHQEGVLEQVDPLRARELAAFCGGVLVADCNVELAVEKAWFEGARRDVAEQDSKVVMSKSKPGDSGGNGDCEGGRERPTPDLVAGGPGPGGGFGDGARRPRRAGRPPCLR